MKKMIYFLSICLISVSVFAAQTEDERGDTQYSQIKAKLISDGKVRVIAKLAGTDLVAKENTGIYSKAMVTNTRKLLTAKRVLEKSNIALQRELPRLGYLVSEVDSFQLDTMIKSGLFSTIIEDASIVPSLVESIAHINADDAHASGYRGAGQAIAIIDTGVDRTHPFLGGRVVEEACFSANTSESTSFCPNGQSTMIGTGASGGCPSSVYADCVHGTHVAGIAAGSNTSFSGVAPRSKIVAVQVFSERDASSCNGTKCVMSYLSDLLAGLEWVLYDANTANIAAVNISGGTRDIYQGACDSHIFASVIRALRSEGIATVAATGNIGAAVGIASPACVTSAISVGSTLDNQDTISNFSNSSSMLDLLAPGSNITSSISGGGFGVGSGTSMAAPHVAGAIAVIKAANPSATVYEIESHLKNTGVSITDPRNNITRRRINVDAAVERAVTPTYYVGERCEWPDNPQGSYGGMGWTTVWRYPGNSSECDADKWVRNENFNPYGQSPIMVLYEDQYFRNGKLIVENSGFFYR